jgi:hypothetical protein
MIQLVIYMDCNWMFMKFLEKFCFVTDYSVVACLYTD